MKRLCLMIFSVGCLASVLTACNTVNGVGRDVQAGGHAISRATN
jgi:entericidin B